MGLRPRRPQRAGVHELESESEGRRPQGPLLLAACAVIAGVAVERATGIAPLGWTAAAIAAAAMLAAWSSTIGGQGLAMLALAVLGASRSGAWAPVAEPEGDARVRVEACAETITPSRGGIPAWTGLAWTRNEDDASGASRRVRLVLPPVPGRDPPQPGARLRIEGVVRRAGAPRNPGEDDPRRAEADLGLSGGLWARTWREVGRCDGFAAAAALARGRRAFAGVLQEALPEAEAGLAMALAAGDGSLVAAEDFDAFQATGTVHVLSVSGMHLAFVTMIVFFVAQAALLLAGREHASARDLRAAAAAAALAVAWLYAGFAGLSLATARALISTALACVAALLGGRSSAWNAWALGIAALAIAGPPWVRTPTFALSFLAVAGMLACSRSGGGLRFHRFVRGPGWFGMGAALVPYGAACAKRWPEETARMTAGAAAATAPVVAAWFGRVPAAGLVANAAAIPLFSVALVPLLLSAAVMPVSRPVAVAIASAAWAPLAAGRRIVSSIASLPACWLDVCLGVWGAAGLSVAVFGTLLLRGLARRIAVLAGLALALGSAVIPPRPPPGMEITFLSVGQGDASVVRFADGSVLVVDAGPERAGRRVLVPYLRSLGVRRIDAIAISHAHPDHTGGLAALVRAFPVNELWLSGPIGTDPGLDAAVAPLAARGTRVVGVGAGTPARRFGRSRVEFLAGNRELSLETHGERDRRNDGSLVLRVSDSEWSALFTGDLERPGEERLVSSGASLRADVVKAPHHGSITSSTAGFVRAVAPRLTVALLGAGNRFGFPSQEVVGRWRAAGSGWLDTASEGAIVVRACDAGSSAVDGVCAWSFVDPATGVRY